LKTFKLPPPPSTKTDQFLVHSHGHLSYDLWEAVARYIERRELLELATVNEAFYNIVLDTRYGEIWWVKLDESMVGYLRRLQYVCSFD
jgi:hypothetical protein